MATLTIRKLDDSIKNSLRIQAANHGHSMEEEVRRILRQALLPGGKTYKLGARINRYFKKAGSVDESIIPPRSRPRSAPDFAETDDK